MTQPITIATWNVNSIKPRMEHLLGWLRETGTDIVLLQETKTVDEAFPAMEIEDLGYNIAIHGQKTYNGVAILSKFPLDDITRGLPGDESDEQARYIEAVVSTDGGAVRVASVYVPNGQAPDSDKFQYKMRFFDRLYAHAQSLLEYDEPLVMGGDYNVAPLPIDVYDPAKLDGTVCYHPEERAKLRTLLNLGLYDVYRVKEPTKPQYSWWDYRGGMFQKGQGYRIDHLLCNALAVDMLQDVWVDEAPRKLEKPSDHTPVVAKLAA